MTRLPLAAAVAALALSGCAVLTPAGPTPGPVVHHHDRPDGLTVASEAHAATYERGAFGQRWRDIDRNGCGQRDDVLLRDLTDVTTRGRCVVTAGTFTDPYTGATVVFSKRRASDVHIDHVVALAEAWRSGAWEWAPSRREVFANDPANLAAASASVNMAKADDDASGWLPADPGRACVYARRVLHVKAAYGLSADPAEAAALRGALTTCPEENL